MERQVRSLVSTQDPSRYSPASGCFHQNVSLLKAETIFNLNFVCVSSACHSANQHYWIGSLLLLCMVFFRWLGCSPSTRSNLGCFSSMYFGKRVVKGFANLQVLNTLAVVGAAAAGAVREICQRWEGSVVGRQSFSAWEYLVGTGGACGLARQGCAHLCHCQPTFSSIMHDLMASFKPFDAYQRWGNIYWTSAMCKTAKYCGS